MTGIVFIILGITLAFLAKGVSDKIAWHWIHSPFSKFKRDGFFGPPQFTSERKYEGESKIKRYLMSTIFVAFTDLWHMSNGVGRLGWFIALAAALAMSPTWWGIVGVLAIIILLSITGFHVIYHWTLDIRKNMILRILLTVGLMVSIVFGGLILNGWVQPKKIEIIQPTQEERRAEIKAELERLEVEEAKIDSIIADLTFQLDSVAVVLADPKRDEARKFLQDFVNLDIEKFVKDNF